MIRHLFVVLVALTMSAGVANAQPKIEKVPIDQTAVIDAQQMFDSYCAACHGKTGVGDGPAAPALTKAPADLTRLSVRNGGSFPEVKVKRYIEGLDEVAAHGSRDMPIWGDLFRSLNRDTAPLRIQALSDHLKKMQK